MANLPKNLPGASSIGHGAEALAAASSSVQSDNTGGNNPPEISEQNPHATTAEPEFVTFRFPITPCSYLFKGEQEKRLCPDGTIRTNVPKEIEELRAKAKRGLLMEIKQGDKPAGPYQGQVAPVQTLLLDSE